ncbi:hypothetical protein B7494_g3681 [Chlorociboria aeruginascens]|nr:hypothetical protein B7494_g3681 [Chlorociboria aeruginascens]
MSADLDTNIPVKIQPTNAVREDRVFNTSKRHFTANQILLYCSTIDKEWEQFLTKFLAIGNKVKWKQEKEALQAVLYKNDEGSLSAWLIYIRMPSTFKLDDTLMISYLSVLQKSFNVGSDRVFFEYFNPQFIEWYTKYRRHSKEHANDEESLLCAARMQKFIDKDSLKKYTWLAIPVETDKHWTIIMVNILEKGIYQYDSLGHASKKSWNHNPRSWTPLCIVVKWIVGMIGEQAWYREGWSYKTVTLPLQTNASDSGVWCLIACRMLLDNLRETMLGMRHLGRVARAAFAEEWRWRIAAELIAGKVNPQKDDIPALPELHYYPCPVETQTPLSLSGIQS